MFPEISREILRTISAKFMTLISPEISREIFRTISLKIYNANIPGNFPGNCPDNFRKIYDANIPEISREIFRGTIYIARR